MAHLVVFVMAPPSRECEGNIINLITLCKPYLGLYEISYGRLFEFVQDEGMR